MSRSAKGLARPAAAVVPARATVLGFGGSVGSGFVTGGAGRGCVALWIAEQAIEQLLVWSLVLARPVVLGKTHYGR